MQLFRLVIIAVRVAIWSVVHGYMSGQYGDGWALVGAQAEDKHV